MGGANVIRTVVTCFANKNTIVDEAKPFLFENLDMDRFSSILILPAVLGALAIASSTHQHRFLPDYGNRENCSAIAHTLPVQEDGCTGKFPVLSCRGTCQSSSIPKFYLNE